MAINYIITQKIDKTKKIPKVLYYASTKVIQKRGGAVDINLLADELAERSSLSPGDVLSVLRQLPDRVAAHLKQGRTVNIKGLGVFLPSVTSDGYETPEEVTPSRVRINRVCFKADLSLTSEVKQAKFMSVQLREMKRIKNKANEDQKDAGEASD